VDRLGIWATERRKWVVGCWIGDGLVVLTLPPTRNPWVGIETRPKPISIWGPNLKTCVGELNPVLNPLGPKLVGT
jgi:hypothetical protein